MTVSAEGVKDFCKDLRIIPSDKRSYRFPLVYMVDSRRLNKLLGKGGYITVSVYEKNTTVAVDGIWQKTIGDKYSSSEIKCFCKKIKSIVTKSAKERVKKLSLLIDLTADMSPSLQLDPEDRQMVDASTSS